MGRSVLGCARRHHRVPLADLSLQRNESPPQGCRLLAAPGRGADGATHGQGGARLLVVRRALAVHTPGLGRRQGLARGVLAPLQPGGKAQAVCSLTSSPGPLPGVHSLSEDSSAPQGHRWSRCEAPLPRRKPPPDGGCRPATGQAGCGHRPSSAFWLLAAVGLGAAGPARLRSSPAKSYKEAKSKSSSGGSNFGARLFKELGQAPFLPRPLTSRMVARVLSQGHVSSWSSKQDRAPASLARLSSQSPEPPPPGSPLASPCRSSPTGLSLHLEPSWLFVAYCLSLPALSIPLSLARRKCLPSEWLRAGRGLR